MPNDARNKALHAAKDHPTARKGKSLEHLGYSRDDRKKVQKIYHDVSKKYGHKGYEKK